PPLMTPGAAEALAVKIYRLVKTDNLQSFDAMSRALTGYQSPVAPEIIRAQISLAVAETSDMDFVPTAFRSPPSRRSGNSSPDFRQLLRLLQQRLGKSRFCVHAGNPKVSPRLRTQ